MRFRDLELAGPRLVLRAADVHTLGAIGSGATTLGRALQATLPPQWDELVPGADEIARESERLARTPASRGWSHWFWLGRGTGLTIPTLVGCGGYVAPPGDGGNVEVCLHLSPGTAAASIREGMVLLLGWAWEHPETTEVTIMVGDLPDAAARAIGGLGFTSNPGEHALWKLERHAFRHDGSAR